MFRFKDLTLERVNVKLSLNNRITHEGPNFSPVYMAANPLASHGELCFRTSIALPVCATGLLRADLREAFFVLPYPIILLILGYVSYFPFCFYQPLFLWVGMYFQGYFPFPTISHPFSQG